MAGMMYPFQLFLESKFPGTLVVIYLNTKNLPAKEEELTDELIIL